MADQDGTTDSPPAEPSPAQLQRQQLIAQALKDKVPSATLDPTSPTYDNLDDAAQAFYGAIGPYDHKTEEAGVVYVDPQGKYRYSIPTVQHDEGFKARVPQTAEEKLAALFHTHPGNDQLAQVFSPDDVAVANQLKVPSYVYFENGKDIRKYVPGVSKTNNERVGGEMLKVAKGDPLVKQALIADTLRK